MKRKGRSSKTKEHDEGNERKKRDVKVGGVEKKVQMIWYERGES